MAYASDRPVPDSSPSPQLALTLPDWARDHVTALIGVPLRIVLIVIGVVLVRKLAGRAITRVVQRILEPGDGREAGRRPGRGPAVLHRDHTRVRERREQRARTIGSVLSSIVSVVLFVVAVAMVLDQVGIALGPLLASAGVVGLAIGFGAQSLVADYLSGMLIMIEDQYGVGDSVDLGEAVGDVEHVGLRLTHVRDLNGGLWHIRNGEILRVRNDSQEWARAVLDVTVAYDANLDEVYRVLEEAGRSLREDPDFTGALLEDVAVWGVQSLDADGVTVRVAVRTAPMRQWAVTRELRRRAKEALDAAGIDIPFAQRARWLRGEGDADSAQALR
ncbi:mechanosensitive ion channel family protein [Streptomyces griseoviridis]|jgi:small conductance mechanosensitive channel|uniref:Mechanosensitive ion channel protein MscS n=3 Tax=Streptomyces TaxID=1883 RepID=A0A918LKD9_STRGD|nr:MULTISPECIES: mechanosensitive ion channel family protein [Streptomyces]MDP9679777.1 small conductance mechanosensitive channel [Streptomyces griseoviridis]GGS67533.1 mechanosensitive ion channel protein MscS [Streptomyces niveoruber]GGT22330.1 mechanosensitive ion channel protein MscS [Streptomyces griseoviridis]GGU63532.1 mechanosensitive ion channel protein MscS [Streptomyces daghestanicus]GHI30052.1 mechanosensitive ion channel protein MscS [Streptomyces daghestanicus]